MNACHLVTAGMLVLPELISAAETERQRYSLPNGEIIVLSVDQQHGPDFCTLSLAVGQGHAVPFWERKAGDIIEWTDSIGGIKAADRKGDDVTIALASHDDFSIYFVQVNLKTKVERVTGVPTGDFYRELGFIGTWVRVTAPNQLTFGNDSTARTRLLNWREDGKPYLDGVEYAHSVRALVPATPPESVPVPGVAENRVPSSVADKSDSANTTAASKKMKPVEDAEVQHDSWRWVLACLGLLLAAAGTYLYSKRPRQR